MLHIEQDKFGNKTVDLSVLQDILEKARVQIGKTYIPSYNFFVWVESIYNFFSSICFNEIIDIFGPDRKYNYFKI